MNIREIAKNVIAVEIEGLEELKDQINESFDQAVNLLHQCTGKVVITGMGKSGLIAAKIAATMSSTGTTSVFLHPAEAIHGDLGIIRPEDVVIGISYSGETNELLKIIPSLRKMRIPLIGISGNLNSTLAKNSQVALGIKVSKEACPLSLAPTASTTSTLALGDALAVCLMELKGFKELDFAVYHPGGSLGRRLLQRTEDEMQKSGLPTNYANDTVDKVILEISKGMLGLTVIVNPEYAIMGLITDGDLRKAMAKHKKDLMDMVASHIMNANPTKVEKSMLINDAELLMMEKGINSLLIAENGRLIGILNQRAIKYK